MDEKTKPMINGAYESEYMRIPVYRTRWQIFKNCLYNPEENTILTRTKRQWGITGLFYIVFFSGLSVLFAICMKAMLATLSDERPRYILDESLIGTNPGLAIRPMDDSGLFISYSSSNETQVKYWIDLIDKFLEDYKNSSRLINGGRNQQICNYKQKARKGMTCNVDVSDWGPCTSEEGYGFNNSSPCIFIKLNKIIGWTPQVYNDTNELPPEMPESLVKKINSLNGSSESNTIWLSCKGRKAHDDEAIGEIEYYPSTQGFPSFYYPYENIPGYLSPLVAVHFRRPQRNKEIYIECRAWAKNIKHDVREQFGVVLFHLLIND
ncbi:hypothetical protein PV327_010829 [Microctonus hyperodae]|uniref:Sodium/potassium-transporting ATPase subunit beta-2 n=1 Tax=Microctonus hyperodae TaxID=165561 RepID=A0AA39EZ77_MICHY|nr:hypothetical protein PV327_010829 [Microctonus hyperodae]